MPPESVYTKAERLLAEGRVNPLTALRPFEVEGDSARYVVVVGPESEGFCSCPATVKCSHIVAAERWYRAERAASDHRDVGELSGYLQRLAERKRYEEVGA